MINADGRDNHRVSPPFRTGFYDYHPTWSPDGSKIIFSSDRRDEYNNDLWRSNPDGSDLRILNKSDYTDEFGPDWGSQPR